MEELFTHQLDQSTSCPVKTSETVDEALLRTRLLEVSVGPEKDSGLTDAAASMLWVVANAA